MGLGAVHPESRAGRGELATALVDGASSLVALAARSPLKLVASRERGPCVRVHAATFGGGLLAGDLVDLSIHVASGSTLAFGTSAPGKVYRSDDGRASVQRLLVRVEDGALAALVPAPVACFADAVYEQRTDVELARSGSLLLVDTLTAGRSARGERWAFSRYAARTRISLGGRRVLHESLHLAGDTVADRFGAFEALSLVVLAGPRLESAASAIRATLAGRPARRDEKVRIAVSALPWGTVLRAASLAVEPLERTLQELLAPARAIVSGGDFWHDQW